MSILPLVGGWKGASGNKETCSMGNCSWAIILKRVGMLTHYVAPTAPVQVAPFTRQRLVVEAVQYLIQF